MGFFFFDKIHAFKIEKIVAIKYDGYMEHYEILLEGIGWKAIPWIKASEISFEKLIDMINNSELPGNPNVSANQKELCTTAVRGEGATEQSQDCEGSGLPLCDTPKARKSSRKDRHKRSNDLRAQREGSSDHSGDQEVPESSC